MTYPHRFSMAAPHRSAPSRTVSAPVAELQLAPLGQVSCVLMKELIGLACKRGIAIAELSRNSDVSEETLSDPDAEISWKAFVQICRNGSQIWSPDELIALGHEYVRLASSQPLVDAARYIQDPVDCYRIVAGPGRFQLISCVDQHFEQVDAKNLRIELKMAEGFEPCSSYFLVRKGFLEAVPTLLGYPKAEVTLHEHEHGAVFEVRLPRLRGVLPRIQHWVRRGVGGVATAERIVDAMESLGRRHEAARQRIELLDTKLEDLAAREEQFENCFHSAPLAMLTCRVRDLEVINVNDKFIAVTGYSRDEIMQRSLHEMTMATNAEARDLICTAISKPGASIDGLEIRLHHRDGSELFVLLSVEQVTIAGELCFLWQAVEITARKQTERELTEYREQLEERVEERSRELRRSLDSLQQVERLASIGTLAAGMAHQVNNPVGAIRAASEFALMCRDQPDASERAAEALETCIEQADRCGQIVHNILQFSRGEVGDRSIEDLREVMNRSCKLVVNYAQTFGATVDFDEGNEPVPVRVCPVEIEQVFVNVLRNAIESGEGKVRVSVRVHRLKTGGVVEIRDNGPGISEEHLPFLFDPFYTTRLEHGGTGLGLSVAHGIVNAHGGTIRADAGSDCGTVITIELPIDDGNTDESERASKSP